MPASRRPHQAKVLLGVRGNNENAIVMWSLIAPLDAVAARTGVLGGEYRSLVGSGSHPDRVSISAHPPDARPRSCQLWLPAVVSGWMKPLLKFVAAGLLKTTWVRS